MNDAQIFLLADWSLLMMGMGYGLGLEKNYDIKNDFLSFFSAVITPIVAFLIAACSVVALIKLVAANL